MIITGNEDLDRVIGGYSDNISLIYGEGGSGKTTLAFLAAIAQLKNNKKVIFLDSGENFSLERFTQLSRGIQYEKILVLKIKNFNDQHNKIINLKDLKNVDLIIVDSITKHFRRLYSREPELARSMLRKQLKILSNIKIPKIFTSEVYSDLKSIQPVSNDTIKYFSNMIIKINKNPRRIIQETPVLNSMYFEIRNEGIFSKKL